MDVRQMLATAIAGTMLALTCAPGVVAQGRIAAAKSIRCSFPRAATGTWKKDGAPDAAVASSALVLRFDAIDADDGTAQLRNGSIGSDVIVRLTGSYLHLMQMFRTGPLYTTTVFDKDPNSSTLKAVHSRHEYFPVPLAGSTSTPEQDSGSAKS